METNNENQKAVPNVKRYPTSDEMVQEILERWPDMTREQAEHRVQRRLKDRQAELNMRKETEPIPGAKPYPISDEALRSMRKIWRWYDMPREEAERIMQAGEIRAKQLPAESVAESVPDSLLADMRKLFGKADMPREEVREYMERVWSYKKFLLVVVKAELATDLAGIRKLFMAPDMTLEEAREKAQAVREFKSLKGR